MSFINFKKQVDEIMENTEGYKYWNFLYRSDLLYQLWFTCNDWDKYSANPKLFFQYDESKKHLQISNIGDSGHVFHCELDILMLEDYEIDLYHNRLDVFIKEIRTPSIINGLPFCSFRILSDTSREFKEVKSITFRVEEGKGKLVDNISKLIVFANELSKQYHDVAKMLTSDIIKTFHEKFHQIVFGQESISYKFSENFIGTNAWGYHLNEGYSKDEDILTFRKGGLSMEQEDKRRNLNFLPLNYMDIELEYSNDAMEVIPLNGSFIIRDETLLVSGFHPLSEFKKILVSEFDYETFQYLKDSLDKLKAFVKIVESEYLKEPIKHKEVNWSKYIKDLRGDSAEDSTLKDNSSRIKTDTSPVKDKDDIQNKINRLKDLLD